MAAAGGTQYNERPGVRLLGSLIFSSRWLQAPIYGGLVVAQLVYAIVFLIDLWHLIANDVVGAIAEEGQVEQAIIMLGVLGLIDVVMIANLLIMVVVGGYETFVSKIDLRRHPDEPEWLSHVNANVLKVKLAMAIIGISSIHLLQSFIEVAEMGREEPGIAPDITGDGHVVTAEGVMWQCIIHGLFILSAIGLALIDRMQVSADVVAKQAGHDRHAHDFDGDEDDEPVAGRRMPATDRA